jgi:hypothetical protein
MKGFTIVAAVLGLGILGAVPAHAQFGSATASANATATVINAIALTKTLDLNFASVVAGGTAGTVVVTPAGARSATGGTTLGAGVGTSAASFTVLGEPTATYSVTLPSSSTLTFATTNTMTADTFTSTPSGSGTFGVLGTQTLTVGSTLHVGAGQATGLYAGTFNVTVAYN